ncbi:MAG TPA: ATP-dependent zinc metalloprotease FtsH [Saprospiraceae bacterium]|jgi:AFG3 family protein|nr:ATP-dependent zinc metalloprotease FtsH [Saprospiraceae bacterium]MBK8827473.1 ATP-dependent zinc metalloprotease FtsH [Saprospiraceae bacterium]MBK8885312.1 ATP-dependent zinc metalloprotease FtsH [Saprospiraceae bacterium]MBK9583329.1 ATP-dependent zinc metalloprotease FtsH [Saprospiraceae bacterium]HMT69191.1 ATP-dependent zinc metalloprotease FtsH [Saprospiraceae bacterium]
MDNNQENNNQGNKNGPNKFNINSYWIYGLIILGILAVNVFVSMNSQVENVDINAFEEMVKRGEVDKIEIINEKLVNVFVRKEVIDAKYPKLKESQLYGINPHFKFTIGDIGNFENKLDDLKADGFPVKYAMKTESNYIGQIINWLLPFLLLIGLWLFIMRRVSGGAGGAGGQLFNIGKSKATLFDQNAKVNITFADVAGLNEAKVEVMEVVDFLKNPKKYTSLGGKIPKGVLLVGPPGTGKTLLAKAVAGEAGVPFFSISGSDFVEMFVGVGASRVRDLFKQAREKAPCIVFIDEIDAIGRARGRNAIQGGNDERENTLNQLLVEMDGFSTDKGVIMMAATNRPDILDSALMRPGRFDRQIGIDPPDITGREEIFKVHLRSIKVAPDVQPAVLSEMTPGFAGADIANICNEAALIAARRNKTEVDLDDFNYALDRVIGGLEKKNKLISPKEKEIIAFHEAGHAICGWFLEHASPLVKVTIVPRGMGTLGYAQYLPKEEYIIRTEQLLDRMCMTLGGRAAERIVFDKISTGAQNDLDQVTKMAYGMVTVYGMNKNVGNVSFYAMSQDQFNKPYSNETARLIDDEVRGLIEAQYMRAQTLLTEKREELNLLANTLLEKEVLLKSDVERLIGPRPMPIDELAIKNIALS